MVICGLGGLVCGLLIGRYFKILALVPLHLVLLAVIVPPLWSMGLGWRAAMLQFVLSALAAQAGYLLSACVGGGAGAPVRDAVHRA